MTITSIITGDTGTIEPINTTLGDVVDNEPYTVLFIQDLGENIEVGDFLEAGLNFAVRTDQDNRPTTNITSFPITPAQMTYEYSKLGAVGGFLILAPEPAAQWTDLQNYIPSKIISTNPGENVPFLAHHKSIRVEAQKYLTNTTDRYLIGIGYGECNSPGSMPRLVVEHAARQCRMTYKLTRGATSDGASGNGDDLIEVDPSGEGTALSISLPNNANGFTGYTSRTVVPKTALTLPTGTPTKIRVKLKASSTESYTLDGAYIGHKSSTVNYSTTPGQFLFSGNPGVTIPAGTEVWSDWLTWSYNKTDDLVFGEHCSGNSSSDSRASVNTSPVTLYYKAAVSEAGTVTVTGYTGAAGFAQLLAGIEMDGY